MSTRPNPIRQFLSRPRRPPRGGPGRGRRHPDGGAVLLPVPLAERPRDDLGGGAAAVEQRDRGFADAVDRGLPEAAAHQRAAAHAAGAGPSRSICAWIDPIFNDAPGGEPVRRIVLRLDRARAAGEAMAGLRSSQQGSAGRRDRPALPRRQGRRRPTAAAPARAGQDAPGHRRLHRDDRRPAALRAGAAALRGAGARAHDQRASRLRWTREKLRTQFIPALLRDWLASVQQPSGFPPLETEVLDEDGAHIFMSHAERGGHMSRSTSAASRSSSSTRSCSNSPRRTSSIARSGACGPATARRRFRRS